MGASSLSLKSGQLAHHSDAGRLFLGFLQNGSLLVHTSRPQVALVYGLVRGAGVARQRSQFFRGAASVSCQRTTQGLVSSRAAGELSFETAQRLGKRENRLKSSAGSRRLHGPEFVVHRAQPNSRWPKPIRGSDLRHDHVQCIERSRLASFRPQTLRLWNYLRNPSFAQAWRRRCRVDFGSSH